MPHKARAIASMAKNMYALMLDELDEKKYLSPEFKERWLEAFTNGIKNLDLLFWEYDYRKLEKLSSIKTHQNNNIVRGIAL